MIWDVIFKVGVDVVGLFDDMLVVEVEDGVKNVEVEELKFEVYIVDVKDDVFVFVLVVVEELFKEEEFVELVELVVVIKDDVVVDMDEKFVELEVLIENSVEVILELFVLLK